ncbi:unnamed protein product [Pleuronectes platessa]|uniref:Uncharacterized protein n=1 Tax=Pleuronectes platessa TaxID=8262 RepID=A0A9N7VQ53_PLEPL|nr:unnamed protein product [Pleuronectes platessa]
MNENYNCSDNSLTDRQRARESEREREHASTRDYTRTHYYTHTQTPSTDTTTTAPPPFPDTPPVHSPAVPRHFPSSLADRGARFQEGLHRPSEERFSVQY